MGKFGDVKQVACQTGHEGTDLGVVVIGEGQLLQMPEEISSHIGLDTAAHDVSHRRHIIVCRGVYNAQNKIQKTATQNEVCRKSHDLRRRRVGYSADDKRQDKLAHRCERRAEKIG